MKVTASDLLAILRRFNVATDDNVPRHIDQINVTNPSPINWLVSFRFDRKCFFVLFDETAEDRESYIMRQIFTAKSDAEGVLYENPTSDLTTYGLPFKGKDLYLFQLTSSKRRLDVVLAERHPEYSRSTWQKYIKSGNIFVNNSPAKSPKQEVTEADRIEINLPSAADYSNQALPILYIDDDVIVINKPAGILTHSKGALNDEFTVADFFRRYTTVGLNTNRPGIVHRLDRDTSGVMMFALNENAQKTLMNGWQTLVKKRIYRAVAENAGGRLDEHGIIDAELSYNAYNIAFVPKKTRAANGKGSFKTVSARTHYTILTRGKTHTLFELTLDTGRKNQIRAHLASCGFPIAGDKNYRAATNPFGRLMLHARTLAFTHPVTGEQMKFEIPEPQEWRSFVECGKRQEGKIKKERDFSRTQGKMDFIARGKAHALH